MRFGISSFYVKILILNLLFPSIHGQHNISVNVFFVIYQPINEHSLMSLEELINHTMKSADSVQRGKFRRSEDYVVRHVKNYINKN